MSNYYNADEMSPVLAPGPEATAPERFEGIYRMPSFVTIPTSDLTASVDFWTQGLDFFELFSVPGQLVHLRRWAFQDVLLVPTPVTLEQEAPAMSVSFACLLDQIDDLEQRCRAAGVGAVGEPVDTPWGSRDLEVIAPEKARVVFTATKPFDPASATAQNLEAMGITAPDAVGQDNEVHA